MENYILEACVDSVESAIAAAKGGATRLELCGSLIIGGITPSPSLFREIRKYTDIKIHALIRPRFGDFCYTDHEFAIMKDEIMAFKKLGAQGVVFGILKPDASLEVERMKALVEAAGDMSVTLHRAFDVCADPFEAMEQAIGLKMDTILTSGQQNVCTQGLELLEELVKKSGERITIQVGSGVNAQVIQKLYPRIHARAYHMSGKETLDSSMVYRKKGVNMGLDSISEYEIWRTEEEKIREAVQVLRELQD